MTFFMALAHYLYIWWLHGMAFHLIDAILFLNIRVNISTPSLRSQVYCFNYRNLSLYLLCVLDTQLGTGKCNVKTYKEFHQIKDGIGYPS